MWGTWGRPSPLDVTRRTPGHPLRSVHGRCRRSGGPQRRGAGPPSGGRAPRGPGRARERPLAGRRAPGGRARTPIPSTPCPSCRPRPPADTGRCAGRPAWAGAGSSSSGAAATSTRASSPSEVVHPIRTGIAGGRPHRHPDRGRGRHPTRPEARFGPGGGRPSQPHRAQPARGAGLHRHGRRLCARSSVTWPWAPRLPPPRFWPPRRASMPTCRDPSSRRRPRSTPCAPWGPTSSGCRWRSRPSPPATPAPGCSGWLWSRMPPPRGHPDRHRRGARRGRRGGSVRSGIVRHVVGSLP